MLVLGAVLGCLDPVATAVAALSSKSPFATVMQSDRRAEVEAARRGVRAQQSDILTAVRAFETFDAAERDHRGGRRLCARLGLNHATLCEYENQRRHFLQILASAGLVDAQRSAKLTEEGGSWRFGEKERGAAAQGAQPRRDAAQLLGGAAANRHHLNRNLVSAVLLAGLYPHVAVGRSPGKQAPLEWHCGKRGAVASGSAAAGWEAAEGEKEVVHLPRDSVNFGLKTMTTRYVRTAVTWVSGRAGQTTIASKLPFPTSWVIWAGTSRFWRSGGATAGLRSSRRAP